MFTLEFLKDQKITIILKEQFLANEKLKRVHYVYLKKNENELSIFFTTFCHASLYWMYKTK